MNCKLIKLQEYISLVKNRLNYLFQKPNLKIKSHIIAPYCSRQAILCVDTMSFSSFLKEIISSILNQTHVFLKFNQFAVYWYADHSNPSSGYKVKAVWITQPLEQKFQIGAHYPCMFLYP